MLMRFARQPLALLLAALCCSLWFLGLGLGAPDCDDTVPKNIICPDGPFLTPPDCSTANYPTKTACDNATGLKKEKNNFDFVSVVGSISLAEPNGQATCWCDIPCVWSVKDCVPGTTCKAGSIRSAGLYVSVSCTPPRPD